MAKRRRDVCALPESEPLWRAGLGFVVFENSPAIYGWDSMPAIVQSPVRDERCLRTATIADGHHIFLPSLAGLFHIVDA